MSPRALLSNQQTMGSNCAPTIDVSHNNERKPTTTETRVTYDNSTWHAMNTTYINSTKETSSKWSVETRTGSQCQTDRWKLEPGVSSAQFHPRCETSSGQFSSIQEAEAVQLKSRCKASVQFISVQFSSVHFSSVQIKRPKQFSAVQVKWPQQLSLGQFSSVQFSSVQFSSVQVKWPQQLSSVQFKARGQSSLVQFKLRGQSC